ncbi:MIP/aquaporin family protein [Flavobacterium ponti]|uniref:MIP/aquaporin family protein n=1 Tax=Flavobacterium ponti TaxID=665133 RepID=A0ABV9P821_9FLAO
MNNYRKLWAEFFGTFLLVLFGTGSVIVSEEYDGIIQAFGIGVVFGLTVWLLIQYFGRVADCHINPAVTLTFLVSKQISFRMAMKYIGLQLVGSLLASLVLHLYFPTNLNLGNTLPSGSWQESFIFEFFLSFALMLVILITTTNQFLVKYAPFLIGFTVFLEAWLAGPICGASMNPARTFGPAVISGNITYLSLYIIAPIVGMILALFVFNKKMLPK